MTSEQQLYELEMLRKINQQHADRRTYNPGLEARIQAFQLAARMQSEGHDIAAEYRQWESWYAYINAEIAPVPGVKMRVIPPAGASPFPVLEIAWDSSRIGMTAGGLYKLRSTAAAHHVARRRRRLFVHPEPVAMKPWRHS